MHMMVVNLIDDLKVDPERIDQIYATSFSIQIIEDVSVQLTYVEKVEKMSS